MDDVRIFGRWRIIFFRDGILRGGRTSGFTGIERGWPKSYKDDICARLELCRGSISSCPGSEMFPFNPEGAYRHPEGWVNYGAAWCLSLAYFQFDQANSSTHVPHCP